MRRRARERQEKRENRPILKRLRATQWRLGVKFAGGAASHFLIFLHSSLAVCLPLFSYKCANFSKLCAVLVV